MKKIIFMSVLILSLFLTITASFLTITASANVMKIQQNGVVKQAKNVGSGNGIIFTLPDLNTTNFTIEAIELAIFEKKPTDTNYKVFGNTKMIHNPTSLNVTFDFGALTKYQLGARYKIGFRYHVRSTDDPSILDIAGKETKDGWRLVGEATPTTSSTTGFSFYLNTAPAISMISISWSGEDINGSRTFSYTPTQLQNAYLHQNALKNGITVNYSYSDPDEEDTLTFYYRLINKSTGATIADATLGSDKRIANTTTATNIDLILYVVDNWGAKTEAAPVNLKIDRTLPSVASQFNDQGKSIRGRELYSKYTINDDSGVPLSSGNVYYSVKRGSTTIVNTTRFSNNANGEYIVNLTNQNDGVYTITITAFDKAYNKLIHTQNITLDNTPPTLRFVPQSEDNRATLYSSWINYNSNIVIDIADTSGIKSAKATENGTNFYNGSGTGVKVFAVPNKTGKLNVSIALEDTACTLNKTGNTVNTSSTGNTSSFSNSVWIDKTSPSATVNVDENKWYNSPVTITANFDDYESASGKGDNSGIKSRKYQIGDTITGNWLTYENGADFNAGGIYFLHVKAIDNAGNETVVTRKVKVNSPLVFGKVRPTTDYLHTIYNSLNDIYIIKNTAFNTKYVLEAQENDVQDRLKVDVRLVNEDNSGMYSATTVYTQPNQAVNLEVIFNMSYLKADGTALPDGVYSMYLTISEIKNDGDVLINHNNIKACEVVIKRASPPKPIIKYENRILTIEYPNEVLSGSLNRSYIKDFYKREYKIVKDGEQDTNVYKPYTSAITNINYDCNVTALYTDPAGNISTATLRVFGSTNDGGGGGSGGGDDSIHRAGDSVRYEEGRPANVYFIGIRRDKNSGIDTDAFNFLN